MDEVSVSLIGAGLAVGAVFAVVVQHYRFCLVAAVSNLQLYGGSRQALAFTVALLVAITGTQLLEIAGTVAISDSQYRNSTLDWFGAVAGGIIFGVGATLAGGCAARTLIRTMEGSIHSLIALISFAIAAALTQFGFLEPVRIELSHLTSIQLKTDAGIASVLSIPRWLVLAIVDAGLVALVYKYWQRSPDKVMLAVGIVIGGLVVFSWYVTGSLVRDEFAASAPSAITLSGPLARFGYFLMSGQMPVLSFATSFVLATCVVSLLLALMTRQFRLTVPVKGMVKMALLGGALMGIGAMMAYGCNIGQGLTGLSTLSLESLLAVSGMVAGMGLVTRWLEKAA